MEIIEKLSNTYKSFIIFKYNLNLKYTLRII